MQLRKEAWKKFRTSTGFEPVTSRYRCDALPTELWSHWRWEQVNCRFICSRESEECKWCIWNNHMNCGNEIKWRLILAVMNAIKCNCVKKPEKNSGLQRGLNPWPRDTGATLYQLSYEATDVGSRSIVGSYVPVKVKNVSDVYEIIIWTAEMKSSEGWSSQLWTQLNAIA